MDSLLSMFASEPWSVDGDRSQLIASLTDSTPFANTPYVSYIGEVGTYLQPSGRGVIRQTLSAKGWFVSRLKGSVLRRTPDLRSGYDQK